MRYFYLILTLFLASQAQSATLKTETTTNLFEGAKIIKDAFLQNDDKSEASMTTVSYGLCKKAVFGLVPLNVYVMQFLAAKPEKLVKTEEGILESLKDAGPIHLHLTFLRSLPGEKISASFKEGLHANKVDTKSLSPALAQILTEVSSISNFKDGETFSITIHWASDKAIVYLTDAALRMKTFTGDKMLAQQLLSIWFGKSADNQLADLKKTLIK